MRLHALQYLRAIAALVVVYSHACIQVPDYKSQLVIFGSFGVDIFFVISGFIMMYIMKPEHKPASFMINRIRRVAPLYWFFTLLMALIFLLNPSLFNNTKLDFSALGKSLFFIPHFSNAHPDEVWPLVAPGWSLNYEMYFYVLFALALLAPERMRMALISIVILVVFVAARAMNTDGPINEFLSQDVVFEFVLGMALAVMWKRGIRASSTMGWFLFIAGFVLMMLYSQQINFGLTDLPGIVTKGIPATLIVAGTLYLRIGVSKLGLLLGDASYALYLSHIFVLGLLRMLLPPILGEGTIAAYLFVFISVIVCTIVGVIVHKLIDDWLLRVERFNSFKSQPAST